MIKGVAASTPTERVAHLESHTSTEKQENNDPLVENNEDESRTNVKNNGSEELQPPLDSGKF